MAAGHVTSALSRPLLETGNRFQVAARHVTTIGHSPRVKMAAHHVITPSPSPNVTTVTGGNPAKMAAPTRSLRATAARPRFPL